MLGAVFLLPYYKYKFAQFRKSLDSAPERQERFLLDLVKRTAATDFGKAHGFARVRSIGDFRKAVPVGGYESVSAYIDREAAGETGAIIPASDAIKAFACTTGTTGKSKILPVTQRWLQPYQSNWRMWGAKCIADHDTIIGTKWLQISGPMNVGTTASGQQIGMVSAISARYQNPIFNMFHAVPATVGDVADAEHRYYAILRLAMAQNCGFLITVTAANFLKLARRGDSQKERLIRDIHDGTFHHLDDVKPHLSEKSLAFASQPLKARAKDLERLASEHGALYPKHYWDLRLICCWLGGTVGYQSRELSEYYGDVARRDIGYISTEGRHTIPLGDSGPQGPLIADGTFFEFQIEGSNETVLPHELEPGANYSVVLTSSNGLFRYAVGDIVRCDGYLGRSPVIAFQRKTNDVSDLEGEKISAEQVALAIQGVFEQFKMPLRGRFSLTPLRPIIGAPYYGIVTEHLAGRGGKFEVAFADEVDNQIKAMNVMYHQKRDDGSLAAPVLISIPEGSWDRLSDQAGKARGTGESQFKHPAFIDGKTLESILCQHMTAA